MMKLWVRCATRETERPTNGRMDVAADGLKNGEGYSRTRAGLSRRPNTPDLYHHSNGEGKRRTRSSIASKSRRRDPSLFSLSNIVCVVGDKCKATARVDRPLGMRPMIPDRR